MPLINRDYMEAYLNEHDPMDECPNCGEHELRVLGVATPNFDHWFLECDACGSQFEREELEG